MPSVTKITINLSHIWERHTYWTNPPPQKDKFPWYMGLKAIEAAVKYAYQHSETLKVQGDRLYMRGPFGNVQYIYMWFNRITKVIESAWPKSK